MREIQKGRPIKKSHVIVMVLGIIAILVLVSVLYVFIEGNRPFAPCTKAPIGLVQQNRTENSVAFLIASVPTGAKIDGTEISYWHEGTKEHIISAEVHDKDGRLVAMYCSCTAQWSYCNNIYSTINWQKGMTLTVYVHSVNTDDFLNINSTTHTFGITNIKIK